MCQIEMNSTCAIQHNMKENLTSSLFVNEDIYGYLAFIVALPGFLFNAFVLCVLNQNTNDLSAGALILFKSQLWLDGLACFLLLLSQFSMPSLDNNVYYAIKCVLHQHAVPLWILYTASAYNIVAIAAQRFVITLFPFKNVTLTISKISVLTAIGLAVLVNVANFGAELTIHLKNKTCLYKYNNATATITWLLMYYAIPTILLVFFYSTSIIALRKRKQMIKKSSKKSESMIFKNAVAVAILFVVFCGPNTIAYVMIYYKAMTLQFYNNYFKLLSWFCTLANSTSTPIIYIIFLKSVRRKMMALIHHWFKCNFKTSKVGDEQTASTSLG